MSEQPSAQLDSPSSAAREAKARKLLNAAADLYVEDNGKEQKHQEILDKSKAARQEVKSDLPDTPDAASNSLPNLSSSPEQISPGLDKFLALSQEQQLQSISNLQNSDLQPGTSFQCNFKGDTQIERAVGLAMIMPVEVRVVKVNGELGYRHGALGNFYTEAGQYVKILGGDQVEIKMLATLEEQKELKQEKITLISEFERLLLNENLPEDQKKIIIETAANYDLDPRLFLAIQKTFSNSFGHDISGSFETEVKIAGKYLQSALIKYSKENPDAPIREPYSAELISFLINHYSLFANETPQNQENLPQLLENYGQLTGKFLKIPAATATIPTKFSTPLSTSPTQSTSTLAKSAPSKSLDNSPIPNNSPLSLEYSSTILSPSEISHHTARDFDSLRRDHAENLNKIKVLEKIRPALEKFRQKALANRGRYEQVANQTGVPWKLIAALHNRESGMNFDTYLHNGQKLGTPTTAVPVGKLFYDWETAAIDALQAKRNNINQNSDLADQLAYAESYNGLGYRRPNFGPSGYVYAGTNIYQGGKYVKDGVYDPKHFDQQLGVAPMLMALNKD
jgi:lysozyme family protein